MSQFMHEPDGSSLSARFERQALATPDRVAVSMDGEHLTYAELNRRANQVAHFLRAQGVQRETLVGLFLDRGIDLIVGLVGILKSGGAYLPMDIAYPPDRLAFMAEDAQSPVILTSSSVAEMLGASSAQRVQLDGDWHKIAEYPDTNPSDIADASSLAYVIYTSGSTGKPKGCEVTHGNVIRLFEASAPTFHFSQSDVWTLFHSHAFDFSVWEMWGAWLFGGRLVIVPQSVARSPDRFLELLARERVTFLNQTPSAFKALSVAIATRASVPALQLRFVVFGGEVVEHESLRAWFDRFGDQQPTLVNGYGITETTVFVSFHPIRLNELGTSSSAPIGRAIADLSVYVVNESQQLCDVDEPGELYIGGAGVARGYRGRPELTAQRFVQWSPSAETPPQRFYRSGDLVKWLPSGDLTFLGRIDQQVKISGFRIELGEIESVITRHENVAACAVVARTDRGAEPRLVAYLVNNGTSPSVAALREYVQRSLPAYMVPSAFIWLDSLPVTANGKLDAAALPAPERVRPELRQPYAAPIGDIETVCCKTFAHLLQIDRVGRLDNFFELGGNSLLAVEASIQLGKALDRTVSAALLFSHATPALLTESLQQYTSKSTSQPTRRFNRDSNAPEPIAIVAMAARLPGAETTEKFWKNLLAERDSLTVWSPEELDASIPASLRADPAYVSARSVLARPADFDPAFFGLSQRDAEIMDPQQRLLLELTWESLERAGYAPDQTARDNQKVGVFAGTYSADYIHRHVLVHPEIVDRVGQFAIMLATDKDYVATRIAHRLNLTGPAISIHTACSTSLVAIVQAVDSLRAGRCTMAVAGAASMTFPPQSGYLFQDGAMLSRDGVTRTFDASASGTVFGDGGAVVVLKRLSDALAEGDQIYGVIRGAALNNDGGNKASFTAPSAVGQAAVIAAAIEEAGVPARSISYVEAHGTATPLGDPVEIEGLTQGFRIGELGTNESGFCRIGTAKSNIGHIVAAAGAVGLIKTTLSLWHETIPATLHFKSPNPRIDFVHSPFVVNHQRTLWPRSDAPRRAGVSAFGVGGTNAHVVVEEAPAQKESTRDEHAQLIRLSARTAKSLTRSATALAQHLRAVPDINLADVAYTLREGRSEFSHRIAITAKSVSEAAEQLDRASERVHTARPLNAIVCVFPGQGAQYAGMGRDLYEAEPVFRTACDRVFNALRDELHVDLKQCMFGDDAAALHATDITQPATFCIEYALAELWRSRGLQASAMIGHSIGEFVAAVMAGVMSVDDAARLVARRGKLMNALPNGAMLSVRLDAVALQRRIPVSVSISAVNAPQSCVLSGPVADIDECARSLEQDGIACRRLRTSHAFHSSMMDPMIDAFEREVQAVTLQAPRLPIVSTVTGQVLTAAEATSAKYWARHAREPVAFSSAIRSALQQSLAVFLEVGPRSGLTSLIQQHAPLATEPRDVAVIASLSDNVSAELPAVTAAVGELWCLGVNADGEPSPGRRRVLLPTYSFDYVKCWLEALPSREALATLAPPMAQANGSNGTGSISASATNTMATTPSDVSAAQSTTAMHVNRRDTLLPALRSLIGDIAGIDLDDAPLVTPFVELGLDSLVLTQVAIQVKRRYSVNITFRQLHEQYNSLGNLLEFLDATLPVEKFAPPTSVAQPSASPQLPSSQVMTHLLQSSMPVSSDDSAMAFKKEVVRQQLQLMAQQLALLGGASVESVSVAVEARQVLERTTTAATNTAPLPASDDAAQLSHTRYDVTKAFGAIARIHTRGNTELSARQRTRLEAFMRRYTARTSASKNYTVQHRGHLADPRVVNGFRPQTKEISYQIVVNRSQGSRVWDLDGNEYVDALNGFGMNLFGWQPSFVNEAVRNQLDEGHEIGPQHPLAGEVAELVCELSGFDRAALCNTGSEAVMGAIRIARTVTGRNLIVIFSGSYHGIFDEVLVRGTRTQRAVPAAPGIMQSAAENVLVLEYGTDASLQIIRDRADDIAAVIVEPVQSRRPDFRPVEFLREVRRITEENGTVLVFDEVITGFRAGIRGAQGLFDIRADLAAYGKVIGGGYPIGVIAGKREFMDALDGGAWEFGDDSVPKVGVTYFAGTFVRHPLALAACKAVLTHLRDAGPALQKALSEKTARMVDAMNADARAMQAPVEVRQFASLWRIAFTEEHPLQDLLWAMMRDRGIHILDNFPCFLTTAHSDADIAMIVRVFREAIAEMQASEFFPAPVASVVVNATTSEPPVPNARLGRDKDGSPAWFVPDPEKPGQYVRI
jgi:amino acid adenylation domain-containing protein